MSWDEGIKIFWSSILLMAEIRRSPVEAGSFSHHLQGFLHPRWLFGISSINSSEDNLPFKECITLGSPLEVEFVSLWVSAPLAQVDLYYLLTFASEDSSSASTFQSSSSSSPGTPFPAPMDAPPKIGCEASLFQRGGTVIKFQQN